VVNHNSERECGNEEENESKEDRYILVVGITKKTAYQFLKIRQHKDGSVYVETPYRYKRDRRHFSYHANGEMHEVFFEQTGRKIRSPRGKGLPIAEFRGQVSLGAWPMPTPIVSHYWKTLKIAKRRKTQAIFCIDVSPFVNRRLYLSIVLLESWRVDLLSQIYADLPLEFSTQFLVITATNPWIVLRAASQ
jgi:hypothetical protein